MGFIFSKVSNKSNDGKTSGIGFTGLRKYMQGNNVPTYDATLQGIANYIRENECKNIVVLIGGGMSDTSWIADLRDSMKKLGGPFNSFTRISLLFDYNYFLRNPQPLYRAFKKVLIAEEEEPTTAHFFIRLLEEKGMLLRCYSETMDNLESLTGIKEDLFVKANGTFHSWSCCECQENYTKDWVQERLEFVAKPMCTKCSSPVRPDIVFFGEKLPKTFFKNLRSDMRMCDLMIIMGTSLSVDPFASLPSMIGKLVPRVVINQSEMCESLRLQFGIRDVFWKGGPDEGCIELANYLGWFQDLVEMTDSNRETRYYSFV